ncbi:MAG: hypothetical protein JW767_00010 [Thermoleophilia bacterium]|nr:hypothetical protein [Thermoleophilia bacterium]
MRALNLALAAVLALAAASAATGALGACGGEGAAEVAGEKYVGFWRAVDVALADCTLMKVWQDGDAYLVRVDCEIPRPASAEGDVLHVMPVPELSASSSPDPFLDPLLAFDLEVKSGRVVLRSPQGSASPVEVELEKLTEAAYEERLATLSDDRVRTELMELAAAVQAWAEVHGGRPPAAGLLAPDSEFAHSLARLGAGWPTNPFTAEPMHAGAGPGDFTYSTADRDFELIGYLSDGEAYAAE